MFRIRIITNKQIVSGINIDIIKGRRKQWFTEIMGLILNITNLL